MTGRPLVKVGSNLSKKQGSAAEDRERITGCEMDGADFRPEGIGAGSGVELGLAVIRVE